MPSPTFPGSSTTISMKFTPLSLSVVVMTSSIVPLTGDGDDDGSSSCQQNTRVEYQHEIKGRCRQDATDCDKKKFGWNCVSNWKVGLVDETR